MSPFKLVYQINAQVSLPLNLIATKLKITIEDSFFQSSLEKRIMYLTKLKEDMNKMIDRIIEHQIKVKKFVGQNQRPRKFMPSDEILLWDKRNKKKWSHGKFESLWKGPFKAHELIGPNVVKLSYLDGEKLPYTYNRQDLKLFKCCSWSFILYIISPGSYFHFAFTSFFLILGLPSQIFEFSSFQSKTNPQKELMLVHDSSESPFLFFIFGSLLFSNVYGEALVLPRVKCNLRYDNIFINHSQTSFFHFILSPSSSLTNSNPQVLLVNILVKKYSQ